MWSLPVLADDHPREECGVVAVSTPSEDVAARLAFYALTALQHRGQEAAGIASQTGEEISLHKNLGLVRDVFREHHLDGLCSDRALGHVRYSTTGASTCANAGPQVYAGPRRTVAVAHNGNLVNAAQLRSALQEEGLRFRTTSDTEVIAALLASRGRTIQDALRVTMDLLKGAYSLCVLGEGKLLACRDRFGIRPLVIGKHQSQVMVVSETCALDRVSFSYLRDVVPGEMIVISGRRMSSLEVHEPTPRPCSFEAIYFARPDSRLGSETVYDIRVRLGMELARDYPVSADAVVGIPDSGRFMAQGYALQSGLPLQEGFIKNPYVGRTFIEPTAEERVMALRNKLNPLASALCGKRLVVIDDSLIRGSTAKRIAQMLRDAGAAEVHMRIASPPARHPCHYGVDMGREGDYIAEGRSAVEVCELIGADSLHYLTPQGLSRALKRPLNRRCTACFTGDYPIAPEDTGKHLWGEDETGDES